ncbi:MAG: phosphoribosyltransferase [bacterium]
MVYKDRKDAGINLGMALKELKISNPVVFGIPRGGVIVAKEVVKILNCPFDIAISRKLGAPFDKEYAIGAINSLGNVILNEASIRELGISNDYIEKIVKEELEEINRRLTVYRGERSQIDITGKSVILVDDGLATGLTMFSVVKGVKLMSPKRIIVAVPVASPDAVNRLKREAEVIALIVPDYFYAVGQFYEEFYQVSDEEVIEALNTIWTGE